MVTHKTNCASVPQNGGNEPIPDEKIKCILLYEYSPDIFKAKLYEISTAFQRKYSKVVGVLNSANVPK